MRLPFFLFTSLLFGALINAQLLYPEGPSPALDIEDSTETTPAHPHLARSLEKRDSFNCKGSSQCGVLQKGKCYDAIETLGKNIWYKSEVRRAVRHTGNANPWHCLVYWKCDDPNDYGGGWSAETLKRKLYDIWDVGGCGKCGSNYFWGSCRVTINFCSAQGCWTN